MYAPYYHHDKEDSQNYGIAIEKPVGPIFSQVYSYPSIKIIKGADAAHPIRSSEVDYSILRYIEARNRLFG